MSKDFKEIKIQNYVYVIELRYNFEFTFYLDRNKSDYVFYDYLDSFSWGEYTIDHEYKKDKTVCPNPIKLKKELLTFIIQTVKRKKIKTFAFSWNEDAKQHVYLMAAKKIINNLNDYNYHVDNNRGLIVFVKNE